MTYVVHIEGPGYSLCRESENHHEVIEFSDWLDSPERVQFATCEVCLIKLSMLGDSARVVLAKMGRAAGDAPGEKP